jgi:hypothetical protein
MFGIDMYQMDNILHMSIILHLINSPGAGLAFGAFDSGTVLPFFFCTGSIEKRFFVD